MSAWLQDKVRQVCPRCGRPSSETSVLCEQHRLDAAARQSRWTARRRPGRRGRGRCAFCAAPSPTYRCELCKDKRRRWDAGQPLGDLAAAVPAQQELTFGAPDVITLHGSDPSVHNGHMANEVSIEDVEQQTLSAIQEAVKGGDHERAHCLAETHEALVRARTLDHQAMRVAAERALRQLDEARTRAAATPNAAVPKAALETA